MIYVLYRIECYTPEAKSVHGYFCLPILWGDRFVGRLDPKADRKQKTLIVRRLMLGPGFAEFDELLPDLARAVQEFARFNQGERITVEQTVPAHIQPTIVGAIPEEWR